MKRCLVARMAALTHIQPVPGARLMSPVRRAAVDRGFLERRLASIAQSTFQERTTVRAKGLEPPHPFGYRDLNPARLPVPPRSLVVLTSGSTSSRMRSGSPAVDPAIVVENLGHGGERG